MFKIYFQSGEFYADQGISWVAIFKDFLIPLLGVGVPLLLFYLGIKQERERTDLQRVEDQNKSDRIDNLRLLYFHSLLIETLKYCSGFQDVLESLKANLISNKYHSENLALDADTDLKRIVIDLDREGLFYAYKMRMNDQSLNIIFKALDAVHGLRKTFNVVWEKANKELTDSKNELRSSTADFGLRLLDVNVDDPSDLDLRDQLIHVFTVHAEQEYSGDRQCKELIESLANPFVDLIERHGKTRDVKWDVLYKKAIDAQILDKKVSSITDWQLNAIDSIANTLDRAVDDLFKHYSPLEEYLIKCGLLTARPDTDESASSAEDS